MTREVVVELRKYGGGPNRSATTRWLGEDDHGVWLGADRLVYLIPHQGWWKARHFPDGGWKIDITTPARWENDRVVLEDLALDVRKHHWQHWVEDQHEFDAAVHRGAFPPEVAEAARAACDELRDRLYTEPFLSAGDRWLGRVPSRFDAAVLVDMGGVLLTPGEGSARAEWERRLRLAPGGLRSVIASAIGPGWEGGRSIEEMAWILRAELGLDHAGLWDLRVSLTADGAFDPILLGVLAARRASTAAAVLSNNGADVRPLWEAALDINAFVDLVVISGEERIAKPDPRIYEIACGRLGVAPNRCLFIDDDIENVEAARAIGMQAVQHTTEQPEYGEIRNALAALEAAA